MSEITKDVQPILVNYVCDDCEKIPNPGCILHVKSYWTVDPPLFVYECPL